MAITNTSTINFDATLPDSTTQAGTGNSNAVNTELLSDEITVVKSSNETYIAEGEKATQTVVITNNSTATMTAPVFTDTMSAGASYVTGSVMVGDTAQPTYDPSTGFTLPDIAAGDSVTITYEITADNPLTTTPVTNTANVAYSVDDPIAGPTDFNQDTNDVSLEVISVTIDVVKSVSNGYALSGDTLTYTSVITNTGTQDYTNLVFTDPIPTGTTFVAGSVTVDGTAESSYDPATGFALADLAAGASTTVVFKVTVN